MTRLKKARMTPRQLRFVQEYLVDLNGKQAAIRAGYKPSCAAKIASDMLRRQPQIVKAVSDAMAAREFRRLLTRERILLEYARIAFADIRQIIDWGPEGLTLKEAATLSDADAAVIAEVSAIKHKAGGGRSRLKMHDKKKALDAIVRLLGIEKAGEDAMQRPEGALSAREILRQRLDAMAAEDKE
jgi:phage terminase small subunit